MLGSSVAYRPYPNYAPWNQFLFWFAICFLIMFLPFLVVDLYYAYRDNTCVNIFPPGTSIQITLKNWLQVDGYIILGFIVIFLILGIIAWCAPEALWVYGLWEGLHIIFILWRMTWLIIGAIMFWKGYAPNNSCFVGLARYMWSMLILGFVLLFVELLLAFLYPRSAPIPSPIPTPVPLVSTPVVTPVVTPAPIVSYPTATALLAPAPPSFGVPATAIVRPAASPFYRPGGIGY